MHRFLVTGTDTDVGKTRVAAALARALRQSSLRPTLAKLVQTGAGADEPGDAQRAGALAECPALELARFAAASDPWSAALAEARPPLLARDLAASLAAFDTPLVAEGSGGLAVPLNAHESFADVALHARLEIVLVIGLRLGCINHALLTAAWCERHHLTIAGAVFVERWGPTSAAYQADVARALRGKIPLVGTVAFDPDEERSVRAAAKLFRTMLREAV